MTLYSGPCVGSIKAAEDSRTPKPGGHTDAPWHLEHVEGVFHFGDDVGSEAVLLAGGDVFGEFGFFVLELRVVAFEAEAAFAEAGDGVNDAGKIFGVALKGFTDGFGVKIGEGFFELCGDEVKAGLVNNHSFV